MSVLSGEMNLSKQWMEVQTGVEFTRKFGDSNLHSGVAMAISGDVRLRGDGHVPTTSDREEANQFYSAKNIEGLPAGARNSSKHYHEAAGIVPAATVSFVVETSCKAQ